MKVAAISIGNSRITAAVTGDRSIISKKSVSVEKRDQWPALAEWVEAEAGVAPRVAVSVNPPVEAEFSSLFTPPLILLGRDRPVPVANLTSRPEETGLDRLVSGFAACTLFGPPVLVVDFGTAFTFNLFDKNGAFLGGAILPGIGLAFSTLAAGCAQLPEVEPHTEPPPLLGRTTEDAIRSGVLNGYRGLVTTLVERFKEEADEHCRVIATGGFAPYFLSHTGGLSHHDPDLLLKGIALAYESS